MIGLTKTELALLHELQPIYEYFTDGSVKMHDFQLKKRVRGNSIFILTYENGSTKWFSTLDELALEINVSRSTINRYLKLNTSGVSLPNCHVKKVGVFGG